MPATFTFTAGGTSYDFSAAGTPQWERRGEYEAQGDATPQVRRTTHTITQTFAEQSFADNEARIAMLRGMLDAGEGVLRIEDENEVELLHAAVRVRSDNVPRAWRQYVAEAVIVFEERTGLASAGALPATFTPTGGAAVALPNVTDWKTGLRVVRFSNERANRDEGIETITATGFILADKTKTVEERLAFLQGELAKLRAANAKDGVLKWGAEQKTVRVQSLDGDLGDGKDRLNWTLAAFAKTFPAGEYAQPEYTVKQRSDYETGQLVTSVSGKVKADTKAHADAAVTALRAHHASSGRELAVNEVSDPYVGGVDAIGGDTWIEQSFSFEFREPLPEFIGYKLKINTREDARTVDKTISYEGTVSGTSAAAALAAARALGFGKLPFIVSSAEAVSTQKNSVSGERFVEVAFTYEYLAKSAWQFAEVTRETVPAAFGDPRVTVSGYAAAATLAEAEALADTFALVGVLLRDSQRSTAERVMVRDASTSTRQAVRVDFSYVYYATPAAVSLAYGRETANDFSTLEKTITFTGIARGPSEAACNSAIDALLAGAAGKHVGKSRKADFEAQPGQSTAGNAGAGAQLISVSFSDRFLGTADNELGLDILQASYSVRTNYSINKASLTLIPYGAPYLQTNLGTTPGLQTVTGSITARNPTTARSWGAHKMTLLRAGGYTDLIEDDIQAGFAPLDGASIQKWTYNFTKSAKYVTLPF